MTHRANQIIERVTSLHEDPARAHGWRAFAHRRISLMADQGQLPAWSIDMGPEQPVRQNTQFIDSQMLMPVSAIVVASDEQVARGLLLEMRRESHKALMADPALGLEFVVSTTFGGVGDVEHSVDNGEVTLVQATTWVVYYRMNIADPGDGL